VTRHPRSPRLCGRFSPHREALPTNRDEIWHAPDRKASPRYEAAGGGLALWGGLRTRISRERGRRPIIAHVRSR
jgi:hypothetical protein